MLAEAVAASAESWQAAAPNDSSFTAYSGGWGANILGPAVNKLFTSLVYSPTVVAHDPIAEWFDPFRGRFESLPGIPGRQQNANGQPSMYVTSGEPVIFNSAGFYRLADDRYEATRQQLSQLVPSLADLAPLIVSGSIVLVPELTIVRRHQRQVLAATRNDTRDQALGELILHLNEIGDPPPWANVVRGAAVTPVGGVVERYELQHLVQAPAYYFHKTMAVAAELNANYIPAAGAESALLVHRLQHLGDGLETKSNRNAELRILPGLYAAELPFLLELDPRLMLAIREDEQAFADWRSELRETVRLVESLPSDKTTFEAEARDVLNDRLMPRANEVQRAVSRSQVMKDATRDSVGTFGVSLASIGISAMIAGPAGASIAALVAMVATPLQWAYKVAFHSSPTGANAVLAQLVQRH